MADPQLYMQVGKAAYDTTYAGISTLGQYSVNRKLARMNAATYRSQARMALLAANRQDSYINEEYAQQLWNVSDAASYLRGIQRASMGTTGFDVSTGDQRLLSDTERRANQQAAGINRTAYLQSFENQMQARLEANRLEYAARSQELIAKQHSPFKAFVAANFAALGAFAGNIGSLGQSISAGNGNNVSPVASQPSNNAIVAGGYDNGHQSVMGPKMPWG